MAKNNFYITTTLPYINSEPHIGFAAEIIRADVYARYFRLLGHKVFFNTGTDEHGQKIHEKALELGVPTQEYCDQIVEKFKDLKTQLNISWDSFIRTTDKHHEAAAAEFWQRCLNNGDIYKAQYEIKYCVGCELEKTESELTNNRCPLHPNKDLEIIKEENYFFKFSNYQEKLLEHYQNNPDFIYPPHRLTEISNFVAKGLKDFSISRLKSKMPWGVPVPGDDTQVMYVWFDALVNYISCLDWPAKEKFNEFWPGWQVCGKDNLRQQTAMWPAMLFSAGLKPSKKVFIFGFITKDGQKISKSLGNTVDPLEMIEKYGLDSVRYYLLKEISAFEDGDFSEIALKTLHNSDLAGGIGNLSARVAQLLDKNEILVDIKENSDFKLEEKIKAKMEDYSLSGALEVLREKVRESDVFLSQTTPWKMTNKEDIKKVLEAVAQNILNIAYWLQIFIPDSATKIREQYNSKMITKGDSLFPRL